MFIFTAKTEKDIVKHLLWNFTTYIQIKNSKGESIFNDSNTEMYKPEIKNRNNKIMDILKENYKNIELIELNRPQDPPNPNAIFDIYILKEDSEYIEAMIRLLSL